MHLPWVQLTLILSLFLKQKWIKLYTPKTLL
jgi:hypothetical protein